MAKVWIENTTGAAKVISGVLLQVGEGKLMDVADPVKPVAVPLTQDPVTKRIYAGGQELTSFGAAKALVEGDAASQGTLVCSWQSGAVGVASTVDAFPDPGIGVAAPQMSGPVSTYVAVTDLPNQSSAFKSIRIKVKASKRPDGTKFAYLQLSLGVDNTFVDRACPISL